MKTTIKLDAAHAIAVQPSDPDVLPGGVLVQLLTGTLPVVSRNLAEDQAVGRPGKRHGGLLHDGRPPEAVGMNADADAGTQIFMIVLLLVILIFHTLVGWRK